jgi:hypothetical protein
MIKLFADLVVAAALPWFLGMAFDWVLVALALLYSLLGMLLVFSIHLLFKKK